MSTKPAKPSKDTTPEISSGAMRVVCTIIKEFLARMEVRYVHHMYLATCMAGVSCFMFLKLLANPEMKTLDFAVKAAFGLAFCIFPLVAVRMTRQTPNDQTVEVVTEAILDVHPEFRHEIKEFLGRIVSSFTKHDLRFEFWLREHDDPNATKWLSRMRGSYKLTVTQPINYPCSIQLDTAADHRDMVFINLRVEELDSGEFKKLHFSKEDLGLTAEETETGVSRIKKVLIPLEIGEYRIAWESRDEYPIDIPYTEFCATAQPCDSFNLIFNYPENSAHILYPEPYRTPSGNVKSTARPGFLSVSATGKFLPFQGIHIKSSQVRRA